MTIDQPHADKKTVLSKISSRQLILIGLAVYFLLSVILRVAVSGTADMDETEHLVKTQALLSGYGSQLPLYTWLQFLFFRIFGLNIFALSLLKYFLLYSTFVCVYLIASKTVGDSLGAVGATLSLFLVPQVLWESYRTLANTVLATLLAAVTLLILLRIRERPVAVNYLLLGAAAGLGMLSKYNYAIFLLALIFAGVATPAFRKCLLSTKTILSLGILALISAPPYIWIVANLDRATASSGKLQTLGDATLIGSALSGVVSLVAAWIGYFWPALIVYALLFFLFKPVTSVARDEDIYYLLKRTLIASFIICINLVLFFKVTYFKERWMQPLLFFLPVYFMYHLGSRLDHKRFNILLSATLVPAILAMVAFSGSVLLASRTGKATRLSPPYEAMAEHIRGQGFEGGTIITDDHRIGGNFRLSFEDSPVLVQGMVQVLVIPEHPALIVWNADKSETPSAVLLKYAGDKLGSRLEDVGIRYIEKGMLYWEEKKMRLGYILIEGR